MTSTQRKNSILWWFTGVMVLVVATACSFMVSGAATGILALAGIRVATMADIAVAIQLIAFIGALCVALGCLANLARRGSSTLPSRWVVGSFVAMFVAGPFWHFCVVGVQERLTGSELVRLRLDNVQYALALICGIPLTVAVPLLLTWLRRRSQLVPARVTASDGRMLLTENETIPGPIVTAKRNITQRIALIGMALISALTGFAFIFPALAQKHDLQAIPNAGVALYALGVLLVVIAGAIVVFPVTARRNT